MNRRQFLWLSGIATSSIVVPTVFTGCAFDPVTGEPMLLLMNEEQEVEIDKTQSPHQFTTDYGANADRALNNYVSQVGRAIAKASHRPQMPYNYRVLDANHVNAYTFPAGSMGVTRGIMVEMVSEAELAALLGHEIGHVNARHSAERLTKGLLAQAAVGVIGNSIVDENVAKVVSGVGLFSATALLAKYSRDNEREADALGLEYAVAAGANPNGMVELMALLNSLHSAEPGALDIMFSSHPMSNERFKTAQRNISKKYKKKQSRDMGSERYMDYTQNLRSQKSFIKLLSNADMAVSKGEFETASGLLSSAKKLNEEDYAYWVITAKKDMGLNNSKAALNSLKHANSLKPNEGLAHYLKGVNYLGVKEADHALSEFQLYEKLLPGNPNTQFFIGFSYEQKQNKSLAAKFYKIFLSKVQQGDQAEHAFQKLKEWGM